MLLNQKIMRESSQNNTKALPNEHLRTSETMTFINASTCTCMYRSYVVTFHKEGICTIYFFFVPVGMVKGTASGRSCNKSASLHDSRLSISLHELLCPSLDKRSLLLVM